MPYNNQYNNESVLPVVFLSVGYASVFYPILLYFRRIPGVNCHFLGGIFLVFMLYSAMNFISGSIDESMAGCGAYKCFVLPDAPAQAFLIFFLRHSLYDKACFYRRNGG